MSDKIVLGYWGFRGKAQVLRHLLSYTGLEFEEKIYKTPEQYSNDIGNIGNFPNLPYLKDGNFIISETLGIARYIVRRGGKPQMLGKNPIDEAITDNFIYAFVDLMGPLTFMFYNKKIDDVKVGHFYKIKSQLERFDKAIRGGNKVMGYPTIADFFLAELSFYIEKLYPQQFPKYKNLIAVRENIMNLPQVKSYYTRENAILTPFLPPHKTAIPFFWPGTQPVIPHAPKLPFKKPFEKKQPPKIIEQQSVSSTHHEQFEQHHVQQTVVEEQNWDQDVQFYTPEYPHKIAVISGSVSGNSSINYLLGNITNIGHPALYFDWCDISNLEVHNEDIDEGTDNANNLRGQVYEANAVLIGVSQTNHMVSTALTNAYNWLVPVLKQKPVALVSIESSQSAFRKALDQQNIPYLKSAKLSITDPSTFFNEEGGIDGRSLNRVKHYFNRLAQFIETGQ